MQFLFFEKNIEFENTREHSCVMPSRHEVKIAPKKNISEVFWVQLIQSTGNHSF